MIDLHTHILPHMDDGAKNVRESLEMIECLNLHEVHTAICTPHFDPRKISIEEFVSKIEKAFLSIHDSRMTLIPGSETRYHNLLYQYSDLDQLCIQNTNYLLLELPDQEHWSNSDFENIEKLINIFRVIPMIAHIERYHFLWNNKKNIRRFMNLGCVMQINANTIIDKKQRKTALHYIKNGLIDAIGSDCHNMLQRPPNLKEAFVIIKKEIGNFYCDLLQQNANSIIKGRMIRNDTSLMLKGSEF
ncbi:MAG: hypothetical protein GX306_02680 [Clostridiales bacterium]|nr:hypothetical protein [Clostridiales bacterium]